MQTAELILTKKAAEQAKQIQQQMKQMLVEFKITG